jgi:hypothetical protein
LLSAQAVLLPEPALEAMAQSVSTICQFPNPPVGGIIHPGAARNQGVPMTPKQAVHKHEAAMHPGKPKTKLAKGGVTTQAAQQMGRNMARVANQGPVGRRGK